MGVQGTVRLLVLLGALLVCSEASAHPAPADAIAAAESCDKAAWLPGAAFARPSTSLLCMRGTFTFASLQQVREIFDPAAVHSLVVNSGGGWTEPAIELAKLAERHGWLVIVKDQCLSSCANYVFLSRTKKIVLPQSVVGWHGLPKDPGEFDLAEFEKEKARTKLPPGFANIDAKMVLDYWTHSKEFLAERGIPAELCRSLPQVGHSQTYVARLQALAASGAQPFWSYGKDALEKRFGIRGIIYMWEPRTPEEGTNLAWKQFSANVFFFDLTN
jgi:hypothetical protein